MLRVDLRIKILGALKGSAHFGGWSAHQDIRTQQESGTYRVVVGNDGPWEDSDVSLDLGEGFLATDVDVGLVHSDLDSLDEAIENARTAVLGGVKDVTYGGCELTALENTMLRAVLTFESIDRAVVQS